METKHCVVCGQGSTRDDWQGKEFAACDSHPKDVVDKAVAAAKAAKPAAPSTPPAPPAKPATTSAK